MTENISLRDQVRKLKIASISVLPSTSSPLPQGSKNMVESHLEVIISSQTKELLPIVLSQSHSSTSNISAKAKFEGKLSKLLGHWELESMRP